MIFVSGIMSSPNASAMTKNFFEAMNSERASSLADVYLITSDGERIPAVRALLRFSSQYFEKLLSSEFAEKNLTDVPVSIPSTMLREVLEFIYTDDCSLIRRIRENGKQDYGIGCQGLVAVFELADVADYVAMERLLMRCKETMRQIILTSSHFSCLVWQHLRKGRTTWGQEIVKEAIEATLGDIEESFMLKEDTCDLKCGLLHLDEQAAEDAFGSCRDEGVGEEMILQSLIVWATGGRALLNKYRRVPWTIEPVYIEKENITILKERREVAKRIASWFDVRNVKPRFLSNIIEPSGLVEHDALYEAYKLQATELEERMASTESRTMANDRSLKKLRREMKELRDKI